MNTALASQLQRALRYHGWAYRQLGKSPQHLDETQYRAGSGSRRHGLISVTLAALGQPAPVRVYLYFLP